jgi:hypothetical protein
MFDVSEKARQVSRRLHGEEPLVLLPRDLQRRTVHDGRWQLSQRFRDQHGDGIEVAPPAWQAETLRLDER